MSGAHGKGDAAFDPLRHAQSDVPTPVSSFAVPSTMKSTTSHPLASPPPTPTATASSSKSTSKPDRLRRLSDSGLFKEPSGIISFEELNQEALSLEPLQEKKATPTPTPSKTPAANARRLPATQVTPKRSMSSKDGGGGMTTTTTTTTTSSVASTSNDTGGRSSRDNKKSVRPSSNSAATLSLTSTAYSSSTEHSRSNSTNDMRDSNDDDDGGFVNLPDEPLSYHVQATWLCTTIVFVFLN
jgi:hypothetical protein